jgi:sodium-dependent dicarboxylate transporter 2/3/5
MTPITRFFRWFGPLAALFAYGLATASEMPFAFAATLALTVLCAAWWMSEAVDPAFTALLPLGLLPVLGILDAKQVAQSRQALARQI